MMRKPGKGRAIQDLVVTMQKAHTAPYIRSSAAIKKFRLRLVTRGFFFNAGHPPSRLAATCADRSALKIGFPHVLDFDDDPVPGLGFLEGEGGVFGIGVGAERVIDLAALHRL